MLLDCCDESKIQISSIFSSESEIKFTKKETRRYFKKLREWFTKTYRFCLQAHTKVSHFYARIPKTMLVACCYSSLSSNSSSSFSSKSSSHMEVCTT